MARQDAAAIAIQSVRRGNLARKEFDLKKKQAAEAAQREAISAQKAEELKAAAKRAEEAEAKAKRDKLIAETQQRKEKTPIDKLKDWEVAIPKISQTTDMVSLKIQMVTNLQIIKYNLNTVVNKEGVSYIIGAIPVWDFNDENLEAGTHALFKIIVDSLFLEIKPPRKRLIEQPTSLFYNQQNRKSTIFKNDEDDYNLIAAIDRDTILYKDFKSRYIAAAAVDEELKAAAKRAEEVENESRYIFIPKLLDYLTTFTDWVYVEREKINIPQTKVSKLSNSTMLKTLHEIYNKIQDQLSTLLSEIHQQGINIYPALWDSKNASEDYNNFFNESVYSISNTRDDEPEIHSTSRDIYNEKINRKNPTMLNILKKRKDDIPLHPRQQITTQLPERPKKWSPDLPLTVELKFKHLPISLASNYIHIDENDKYTSNLKFPGFDFVQANSINSNKLMAETIWSFMDQYKDTKVWFFAGRGKSGSGKTSTLVFLNLGGENDKDGVLVEVIKQMNPQFIDIMAIEIGSKEAEEQEINRNENIMWHNEEEKAQFPWLEISNTWNKCGSDKKVGCDSDDVDSYWRWINAGEYAAVKNPTHHVSNFKLDGGDWVSSGTSDKSNETKEEREYQKREKLKNLERNYNKRGGAYIQGRGTSFKQAIVNIFEKARTVYATENNQQSSRSHVVACVICKDSAKNVIKVLPVADLAGIENRFDCDTTKVTVGGGRKNIQSGGGKIEEMLVEGSTLDRMYKKARDMTWNKYDENGKKQKKSFYGIRGNKDYNKRIDYPESPPDATYKYLGKYSTQCTPEGEDKGMKKEEKANYNSWGSIPNGKSFCSKKTRLSDRQNILNRLQDSIFEKNFEFVGKPEGRKFGNEVLKNAEDWKRAVLKLINNSRNYKSKDYYVQRHFHNEINIEDNVIKLFFYLCKIFIVQLTLKVRYIVNEDYQHLDKGLNADKVNMFHNQMITNIKNIFDYKLKQGGKRGPFQMGIDKFFKNLLAPENFRFWEGQPIFGNKIKIISGKGAFRKPCIEYMSFTEEGGEGEPNWNPSSILFPYSLWTLFYARKPH